MKNDLYSEIEKCSEEIEYIEVAISRLGPFDKSVFFLTNYALIKAYGTIEFVFHSIVADYFNQSNLPQIHTYLENTVRTGSMSAQYGNMCRLLKQFDDDWANNFKDAVNGHPDKEKILNSIQSLVTNRHSFAHGYPSSATFSDIQQYYLDALLLISIFDSAIK